VEAKTAEQPSQLFRVFCTEYEPKKLGWTSYCYGKAYTKQLAVNRTHRIICVPFPHEAMEQMQQVQQQQSQQQQQAQQQMTASGNPFSYLKNIKENDITPQVKTDGPFFEVLLSLLSSLSIERKLNYFASSSAIASASAIKFTKQQQSSQQQQNQPQDSVAIKEYTLLDLIRTSLYEDIKREYFYKDQGLARVQKIIDHVTKNINQFMTEEAIYSVWLVLSRLVSHTYWRSLRFVSDLKQKREKLIEITSKFGSSVLIDKPNLGGKTVKEIKERAEKDAEDGNRLKLQDLMKLSVFPFYGEQ